MTFASLPVGATFTGRPHPHFYETCIKLGPRTYKGLATGSLYRLRGLTALTLLVNHPYPIVGDAHRGSSI